LSYGGRRRARDEITPRQPPPREGPPRVSGR